MGQTRTKMRLSCLERTFEWYKGAMVFRFSIFSFCLETTVRENNWIRRTFVTVMVIFSRKCHSESTWLQPCSKFFLNNYETPWQRYLKYHLTDKILRTLINIGFEPAVRRTLHLNVWLIRRNSFAVWLWPQLDWCSMYVTSFFRNKSYNKYQSSLF